MAMCQLTIPYMHAGAQIINIASVAACQPVPYIGVYAASKAFVLSYSRSLNRELDDKDISVMAVCPFWTKTEFFDHAVVNEEKPVVKKYAAMYEPQQIVARAWRDAKRGKDVSKYGFVARLQMAPAGLPLYCKLSLNGKLRLSFCARLEYTRARCEFVSNRGLFPWSMFCLP